MSKKEYRILIILIVAAIIVIAGPPVVIIPYVTYKYYFAEDTSSLPDKKAFRDYLETNYSEYKILSIKPETYAPSGFTLSNCQTGRLEAELEKDGQTYTMVYDGDTCKFRTDIY